MNEPSQLQPFTRALADSIDAELRSDPPVPDVLDVLARVEALAPATVRPGFREQLRELAPLPLAPRSETTGAVRAQLAPFTEALRNEIEHELRGTSSRPLGRRAVRRSRVFAFASAGVLAAASVVALVAAIPRLREIGELQLGRDGSNTQAQRAATDGELLPTTAYARDRVAPKTKPVEQEEAPEEVDIRPTSANATVAPVTEIVDRGGWDQKSRRSSSTRKQQMTELEHRAREHWQRGDLVAAERLFRRVIKVARTGPHAELAYGDLSAIARERGGIEAQSRIWREYLGKFPRGRFADDARAGLCRRQSTDARARCWRAYLVRHPHGSHADEARRLVADSPNR
jgi:hypothetical protein